MKAKRGRISAIFFCLEAGRPSKFTQQVTLMGNYGMQGDRHAKENSLKQLLLVNVEALRAVGVKPGLTKENFTVSGLDVDKLAGGTRLKIGSTAIVEITQPCAPCGQMNRIRAGLAEQLKGRRGVYARVVRGGIVYLDDVLEVMPRESAATDPVPLVTPSE
jgi:hypothetical protein